MPALLIRPSIAPRHAHACSASREWLRMSVVSNAHQRLAALRWRRRRAPRGCGPTGPAPRLPREARASARRIPDEAPVIHIVCPWKLMGSSPCWGFGMGMNSASSPGTLAKRPARQSSLAWFDPLARRATKFHQTCRGGGESLAAKQHDAAAALRGQRERRARREHAHS